MIFADSSIWIDYFNGKVTAQTEFLNGILGKEHVVLGDLVLMEVLQGFRNDRDFATARELLASLPVFDLLGTTMAIRSAENFRKLRRRGITIRKTIDVIIATYCIEHTLPLLHADKDFEPFHEHLNLIRAVST